MQFFSSHSIWFCHLIRHSISVSDRNLFHSIDKGFYRYRLAPLFALINNLIELRFDAWKMLSQFRRPVLYKAADIGVWTSILSVVSYLAVLTNVSLFVHKRSA